MVALRHTVVLAPVPRPWLADAVAVLLDLAESTRAEAGRLVLRDGRTVPDVRLAEGRHLRPGAVYESTGDGDVEAGEPVRITVGEWNRRRALRLALAVSAPDAGAAVRGTLHRPDRPRLVEIGGRARVENVWSPLSRVSGGARLRCDDWWAAADTGRSARTAPLRARAECGAARAELRVVPAPGRLDGRWDVTVTVRLRGRRLYRPVAAVALRLARSRLQRSLAGALDELAARWNTELPRLVAMGPDALREAVLTTGT
ncbi:hypothetical protein [Streptomyces marokkonensis]|uniref:hypothetical protein n=1 Tax=Streptomyces marokkonensis TaxID=324855 RepID=UPI0011F0A5E1|nr:hypothetical protein [Streptomyces marokkonensis]